MKITPLEIRQKTFEKAFRGVDKEEVNAFLVTLSQQWEKMLDENRELRLRLEAATKEVQKMKEVESTLYRTLKTAEDTGNNMVEQASKEAALQLRESQLKSDQLLNDARLKARSIIEDAYSQSEKAIGEMHNEVKILEQEHQRLESYLDNLLRDLKNLATDALDKVEKNAAKPRPSLSSILARAANIKVKRTEQEKVFQDVPSGADVAAVAFAPAAGRLPETAVKAEKDVEPIHPIEPIQPEVPQPQTPVPDVPAPNIEPPRPDIPEIEPNGIEQPIPEIQPVQPDRPEIMPPNTQPGTIGAANGTSRPVKETAPVGLSFFDEIE
jgi:cell division initiation protein